MDDMNAKVSHIITLLNRQAAIISQLAKLDNEICVCMTDLISTYGYLAGVSGQVTTFATTPKDPSQ